MYGYIWASWESSVVAWTKVTLLQWWAKGTVNSAYDVTRGVQIWDEALGCGTRVDNPPGPEHPLLDWHFWCNKIKFYLPSFSSHCSVLEFICHFCHHVRENSEDILARAQTETLCHAKLLWIKDCQSQLQTNKQFSLWKHHLDLFRDEAGVWQCGRDC